MCAQRAGAFFLLVSLLQANTPLFLDCLLVHLPQCKAYLALIVQLFMGVESVPRATYISTPSKPVFFSSGIEVTSEHAGISAFLLSHQLRCKAHLASTVLSLKDSMESCLVGPVEKSRLLHTSQGLNPMWARSMHMLVILESNWCLAPCTRKKRNQETVQRHSKALKKAQRDAKLKIVAQPEISHEAAELILRNQAIRTDEISWYHSRQPPTRLAAWSRERVFLNTQCGAVNASGALRLLKSQCDGSGESRQKAWSNAKRTCYGRCEARIFVCAVFP